MHLPKQWAYAAPEARETFPKGGGVRPPSLGKVSWVPGAAYTSVTKNYKTMPDLGWGMFQAAYDNEHPAGSPMSVPEALLCNIGYHAITRCLTNLTEWP